MIALEVPSFHGTVLYKSTFTYYLLFYFNLPTCAAKTADLLLLWIQTSIKVSTDRDIVSRMNPIRSSAAVRLLLNRSSTRVLAW